MTSATVVKWLKSEGDEVSKGEPLLEVETEKVNTEMESPAAGVVAQIVASEGQTVDVGSVLVVLAEPGEEIQAPPKPEPKADTAETPAPAATETQTTGAGIDRGQGRVQIEPGARRLARQLGIKLQTVQGTGPRGRVTVEDVEKAAQAPMLPEREAPAVAAPMAGMRKTIAERMLRSSQQTAPLTLTMEADVTGLAELREGLRSRGVRPLHIIVKAVAVTLKEHPAMNAHVTDDGIRLMDEVNVGVAVALDDGLIVPVVRDADQKGVDAIAEEVRALAEKARQGKLEIEDVTGGTLTITNLGALDVDAFTPILNQPEVAILGVGRIAERPAIYQGSIAKRSMMWLSLTFDHRAVDGAPAAAFLRDVKARLEDPSWLIA
jgi:pyruvate dehydrogenase E2 component (dihydrolipoamide acetyltransferase)